jgi:hypothetical protein
MSVQDSATRHPNQLLADLALVMRATAETSRKATLKQCRADAKAYVERLRAGIEAEGLRQAAEDDVVIIGDQSKASVERVRAEAAQRIARRRELLEQELRDYGAAVDREMARVHDRVTAFETEVSHFFESLLEGTDPMAFAAMASQAPDPPAFAESDLQALTTVRAAGAETPGSSGQEEMPAYWWLDSPAKIAARAHPENQA